MRTLTSNSTRRLLALALCALMFLAGCNWMDAAEDVASGASAIVTFKRSQLPAGDPALAKYDHFLTLANSFRDRLATARSKDEQVKLLPLLADVTSDFRTLILPTLINSPTSALLVVAVDTGLRILARNMNKLAKESPALTAQAEGVLGASAVDSSLRELETFLQTPKTCKP